MKASKILLLTMVFVAGTIWSAEAPVPAQPEKPAPKPLEKMPVFNIEAHVGFGYQLFGEQIRVARDSLTPTPDYYMNLFYGGKLTVMPASFGFTAEFQRHIFSANSWRGGNGYDLYTYDKINAGFVYAIPLKGRENADGRRVFLLLGAGMNYTMLQLSDKFKSDLQRSANQQNLFIAFDPNSAKGFGGFAHVGVAYYFNAHFFFSGGIRVSYINPKFDTATKNLDAWGLEIPFGIGIGF